MELPPGYRMIDKKKLMKHITLTGSGH